MLATPHTITGLLIATEIRNPLVSVPLALLSHFALDLVPHWDFFSFRSEIKTPTKLKVILDFALGLTIGLTFTIKALPDRAQAANILLSCAVANLPDAVEAPFVFFGYTNSFIEAVINLQRRLHSRLRFPWGLLPQILLVIAGLAYLF